MLPPVQGGWTYLNGPSLVTDGSARVPEGALLHVSVEVLPIPWKQTMARTLDKIASVCPLLAIHPALSIVHRGFEGVEKMLKSSTSIANAISETCPGMGMSVPGHGRLWRR